MTGIAGVHLPTNKTDVWLTPPHVLAALDTFDLDPCAAPEPRPWPTAICHYVREQDGLSLPWWGRVWLNPPYGAPEIVGPWLTRMARHSCGTALIFARTETDLFFNMVWEAASAALFLRGRLFFHHADGSRARHNSGAPSVLIAYGEDDAEVLHHCGLDGKFVPLRPQLPPN